MPVAFPLEIQCLFIDNLWDSTSDLKCCSLVARSWLERSRPHLFYSVSVSNISWESQRAHSSSLRRTRIKIQNWELVRLSDHISSLIHTLSIGFDANEEETDILLQPLSNPLPRLNVLELYNLRPRSSSQLVGFLQSVCDPGATSYPKLISFGLLLRHPADLISSGERHSSLRNDHRFPLRSLHSGVTSEEIDDALFLHPNSLFDLNNLEELAVQTFLFDCRQHLVMFGASIRSLEVIIFMSGIHIFGRNYPSEQDIALLSLVPNLVQLSANCQHHASSLRTLVYHLEYIIVERPFALQDLIIVLGENGVAAVKDLDLDHVLLELMQVLPSIKIIRMKLVKPNHRLANQKLPDYEKVAKKLAAALPETEKTGVLQIYRPGERE